MAKQSSQQASQQAPVINGKFKVQKTRQITPDRKPAQNGDSSRDELAKTMSSHNARRRKRPLDEDSGSEDDQSMAPNSPHKVSISAFSPSLTHSVQAATKPKPLKKPATNSAKVAASQPPASKPFSKPVMKQTSRSASQPISQPISQPASQPISRSTPQTVPTKRVLGTTRTSNLPPTKTTASRISEGTLKASAGNARNGDNDDEEAGAEERSRSNSTVTLMPSSNGASQSHGESQLQVPELEKVGFDKGKLKKTGKAEKNESAAMAELNILCRRYFLTYLSNTYVDEPIRAVFPGMKIDHPVYKDAKRRVQSSYKTWKGQVLVAALGWVQRWISSARGARLAYLSNLSTFADIKGEIHANFDDSWLETVFKFGIDAVDFEDISLMGLRFLKCKRRICYHLLKASTCTNVVLI